MKYSRVLTLVASLACVAFAGCDGSIYNGNEAGYTSLISSKSHWRAFGDFRDAQAAVDGSLSTHASTGNNYRNAKLTVDLGKPSVFNLIVMDQGAQNEDDFCRKFDVLISDDNIRYYRIYTAQGTRRITYVNIMTPKLARYVRFQATVQGDRPWRIAEIYFQ